jgi:hypothetical protein
LVDIGIIYKKLPPSAWELALTTVGRNPIYLKRI